MLTHYDADTPFGGTANLCSQDARPTKNHKTTFFEALAFAVAQQTMHKLIPGTIAENNKLVIEIMSQNDDSELIGGLPDEHSFAEVLFQK